MYTRLFFRGTKTRLQAGDAIIFRFQPILISFNRGCTALYTATHWEAPGRDDKIHNDSASNIVQAAQCVEIIALALGLHYQEAHRNIEMVTYILTDPDAERH